MFDLLLRALTHPRDYAAMLTRHNLTYVTREELGEERTMFTFRMPEPFSWQSGQHGVFYLPGKKITGQRWRPFSVASSPKEGVVKIATSFPPTPSSFKQALRSLEPGDPVTLFGPYGEFHPSPEPEHIVGIAGGIGITPFRALAYDIAHNHLPRTSLTLIYSARDTYAFKNELDRWQSDRLKVTYVHTPEETTAALDAAVTTYAHTARYFLSGSPGLILNYRTQLKARGIERIINDPFKGY